MQIKASPLPRRVPRLPVSTVIKPPKTYVPRQRVNKTPQQACRSWLEQIQQRGANSGCN
ncbi:MAG TPA: hypothetical protein V6D09_18270 [Leptolyngbyaceae cyanobacterium]